MKLGKKIREVRLFKNLTLEALAKRTQLTISFLSQVERDIASPSVQSLRSIAKALNTRISSFFEEEETKETIFIRRKREKGFVDKKIIPGCEALASNVLNIKMEPLLFNLEKGKETGNLLRKHEGEEFGLVIKGKIDIFINDRKWDMEAGDSIYFISPKMHKIVNVGEDRAVVLWIILRA